MKKLNPLNDNLLINRTILLISPDSWGISFNSKHHYAVNLASINNSVFFLNPPSEKNKLDKIRENLWLINYKPTVRGIRYMPEVISGLLVELEVKRIEIRYKIKFDIIWNFDSSRFFNLSRLKNKIKIAHIVDWTEDFQRNLLCRTSNLNLCTSNFLEYWPWI